MPNYSRYELEYSPYETMPGKLFCGHDKIEGSFYFCPQCGLFVGDAEGAAISYIEKHDDSYLSRIVLHDEVNQSWYDYHDDMLTMSACLPNILFRLVKETEGGWEPEAFYYLNGRSHKAEVKRTIEKFDREKLE